MQRRIIVGVLATVLAVVGAGLLFVYVRGADERALAGQQTANVLVVTKEVPRGTPARSLGQYVQVRRLPQSTVVEGAVSGVAQLAQENVASTTLQVGEQVLASRFVQAASAELITDVPVPEGLQLMSVQLEPQRVLGSNLKAGDTVGIIVSMKVKQVGQSEEIPVTHTIADKVLVVRAQGAVAPATTAADAKPAASAAPSKEVIVTLAVDAQLAERVAFGQEFGKLWLSVQSEDSRTGGTGVVHAGNVYGSDLKTTAGNVIQ